VTLIEVPIHPGFKMWLDDAVEEHRNAAVSGYYEYPAIESIGKLMPPDGVLLDIGANIGFYTCAMAWLGRAFKGRVHAFEPVPDNYELLLKNIALNKLEERVAPHRLALGLAPGTLTLRIEPGGAANNAVGDNMMTDADRGDTERKGWRTATAEIRALDAWAAETGLDRCDILKIDVEGADLNACRGGAAFLARTRPVIFGEFSPYWMRQIGQSFADAVAFFEPMDYAIFREVEGQFLPYHAGIAADLLEAPVYLLVPREKLADARNRIGQRLK
jgi:FkbM family methyltransferase